MFVKHLTQLKEAVKIPAEGHNLKSNFIRYHSYRKTFGKSVLYARAAAQRAWFEQYPIHIYEYDRVAGSYRGNFMSDVTEEEYNRMNSIQSSYGELNFRTNSDHFAPGYDRFLQEGICGMMARIEESLIVHKNEPEKVEYLLAQKEVLEGLSIFIRRNSEAALDAAARTDKSECREELEKLAADLAYVVWNKPVSFRQALNLVWLVHISLTLQEKYAIAFGRMDQYLYPFYRHDIDNGVL